MNPQRAPAHTNAAATPPRSRTPAVDARHAAAEAGNLAMQTLLRSGALRAKLVVGSTDDPEEAEADQTADRLMRSADGSCCSSCGAGSGDEESILRRKPATPGTGGATVSRGAEANIRGLYGGGEKLPPQLRSFFEPRIGRDLSDVIVHRDTAVAETARGIGARAYTLGSDIAFAAGQWQPETQSGRHLIAHELAHVAQGANRIRRAPDASSGNWFSKGYENLKAQIPQDYRDTLAQLATATTEGVKNAARDELLKGIGGTSGVVKQVTEIADTLMWVGRENRDLRDNAIKSAGGKDSVGGVAVKTAFDVVENILLMGTGLELDALAAGSDALENSGAGKDEFGRASITASYSGWANSLIKKVETSVGGVPDDPLLFTPAELAELATMVGTQVALSFVGVEEVKVVLNILGALQGIRGMVETIRHNENWKTDPVFWGNLIGAVLAIVGLGASIAKPKIIQIILKYGWAVAAIPPLVSMVSDFDDYLNGKLSEEEAEARAKKDFTAACNVLKDAVLHVAQSRGGNTAKGPGSNETAPPAEKQLGTTVDTNTGTKTGSDTSTNVTTGTTENASVTENTPVAENTSVKDVGLADRGYRPGPDERTITREAWKAQDGARRWAKAVNEASEKCTLPEREGVTPQELNEAEAAIKNLRDQVKQNPDPALQKQLEDLTEKYVAKYHKDANLMVVAGPQEPATSAGMIPGEKAASPREMFDSMIGDRGFDNSVPVHQIDSVRKQITTLEAIPKPTREQQLELNRLKRQLAVTIPEGGGTIGQGYNTYAVVQVVDTEGNLIALGRGKFVGDLHAEELAIADLRASLAGKNTTGARVVVVGDQVVCPDVCRPALQKFASDIGSTQPIESYVYERPKAVGTGLASPKATARTVTQQSIQDKVAARSGGADVVPQKLTIPPTTPQSIQQNVTAPAGAVTKLAPGGTPPPVPPSPLGPLFVDIQGGPAVWLGNPRQQATGAPTFLPTLVGATPGARGILLESGDYIAGYAGITTTNRGDLAMTRILAQNLPQWPAGPGVQRQPLPWEWNPSLAFPTQGQVQVATTAGPAGTTPVPQAFFPPTGRQVAPGVPQLIPTQTAGATAQQNVTGFESSTHHQLTGQVDRAYWRRPFGLATADAKTTAAMGQEISRWLRPGGFLEIRLLRGGEEAQAVAIAEHIPDARVVVVGRGAISAYAETGTRPPNLTNEQWTVLDEAGPDIRQEYGALGQGTFARIVRIYRGGSGAPP